MPKILFLFSLLLLQLTFSQVSAQSLTISQFDFSTAIAERQPVGVDTAFASTVGNVFCFTHIEGAQDSTQIAHVWYYKDQEKARITLSIRSNSWRTWSSKKIQESWTGPWRVMIEDSNGNVLDSKSFVIRE